MKSLACTLTTPELQKRKAAIISKLKMLVLEKQELADGYSYRFSPDTPTGMLDDFIEEEKQCCGFLNFLATASACGDIWLVITGPDGTKEFIDKELEF